MNIYSAKKANNSEKFADNIFGKKKSFQKKFLERRIAMPENYARENTNKASNKKSGSNCGNSMNKSTNARTPMSKQNAAQRKTEDCDR